MDYALLAGTALGAIALYMMLPRERAPVLRLGGLLGAMALAGFFLFLVQLAGKTGAGVDRPPVYFYLFAAIMIAGAVGVITQPRPVYAALYFVLVTLAGAGMFVLLMAEFMAIVLIIIYAGAILVTYVFVIMLASQASTGGGDTGGAVDAPAYDRRSASGFAAVATSFLLAGAILQVLLPGNGRTLAQAIPLENRDPRMSQNLGMPMPPVKIPAVRAQPAAARGTRSGATRPAPVVATITPPTTTPTIETTYASTTAPSNVQVLGASLYSQYSLSLELAGVLLTIALVGAVIISRKNTNPVQTLGSGKLPSE